MNESFIKIAFTFVETQAVEGFVLVIFSFFWMDNDPPECKNVNIHHIKKNCIKNYVELDFSMGTVIVIF